MNHRDIAVLMDGIAPVLRGYVEKAFEPIGARMTAIERSVAQLSNAPPDTVTIFQIVKEVVANNPAPAGPPGKDCDPVEVANLLVDLMPVPAPGKDADPETILRLVEETVARLPPPEPGKDADPALVAELVDKAVAALEPAKDGEPGTSVTVEDLAPFVAEEVAKAVSGIQLPSIDWSEVDKMIGDKVGDFLDAIPAPQNGKDADPVMVKEIVAKAIAELPPAKDGADGKEGAPGKDADPEEIVAAVGRAVSAAVDKIPLPKDGRDGRDASDLQVISMMIAEKLAEQFGALISSIKISTPDDGRTWMFEGVVGSASFKEEIKTGFPLHRGVWREQAFEKGDCVSYGGQTSIARRDTEPSEKPMDGSPAWQLVIKKGRDGKEGKPGPQGEKGLKGDAGTPGRNY